MKTFFYNLFGYLTKPDNMKVDTIGDNWIRIDYIPEPCEFLAMIV